jgi:hypothetical protein
MNQTTFLASLTQTTPPADLTAAQAALWYGKKGNWDAAHACVQQAAGWEAAWVHAYLHRWEGDDSNAAYWYCRAGRSFCRTSLEEEWQEIFEELVAGD